MDDLAAEITEIRADLAALRAPGTGLGAATATVVRPTVTRGARGRSQYTATDVTSYPATVLDAGTLQSQQGAAMVPEADYVVRLAPEGAIRLSDQLRIVFGEDGETVLCDILKVSHRSLELSRLVWCRRAGERNEG